MHKVNPVPSIDIDGQLFLLQIAIIIFKNSLVSNPKNLFMYVSGNFKAISNAGLQKALSDWETILKQLAAKENICESYRSNIKTIYIQNGNLINEWIIKEALDSLGIDPGPYQFDMAI